MDRMVFADTAEFTVEHVNARHWPSYREARRRARRRLRPIEVALLSRYREQLSGDVLELGSRGDQFTALLAYHARSLTGIGASGPTVALCRERHPEPWFLEHRLLDVGRFEDGPFDAVVAHAGALDLLDDARRRQLLARLSQLLSDDGVLLFCSHNLACESLVRKPFSHAIRQITSLWRLPVMLGNRAQLGRLQRREHGYAILNDHCENFGMLHYYISRDAQESQLRENGWELLECVTLDDEPVKPGEFAYGCRELYYVAQRA